MTTESAHGVSRTVLPGGLRVVTEFLPAVRSVALGIWVGVGSRDEDQAHAGATHYLEHLLFKGTRRRTALEISAEMDAAGGEMNAFTAKEYTCYYARVLDADLPLAAWTTTPWWHWSGRPSGRRWTGPPSRPHLGWPGTITGMRPAWAPR